MPGPPADAAQRTDGRLALLIGVLAAGVATAGSWVPSLWGDEVASIMSARRDWASLWGMLGNVDAVHGLYYALLHLWIDLVGDSPFAVRLPSGIAVGAASAGVYVLVRRRADRGTAVIAAILFLVLPRVLFVAIEARSMPVAIAAATWLTVLLLRLLDAPARRAWWILYALGLAAATCLFLFVILLIPVHALVVLADRRAERSAEHRRAPLASFGAAWAAGLLVAAPIVLVAVQQREQIAFRAEQQVVTPEAVVVGQWFMLQPFALAAWSLIAVACIAAVAHRADPTWRGRRQLLLLAAAWTLLPTLALLAATALVSPVYTARYLVVAAPGVAIAMAIGVAAVPWTWARVVVMALVVAIAVPAYVEQRRPYAKHAGTDWQAVAAIVDRSSRPGDGIVFDESVRPSRRPRLAMHGYPDAFAGLVDLGLLRPYDRTDGLWDVTTPLAAVPDRLRGLQRVLVVARSSHGAEDDLAVLRSAGFVQTDRMELESDVVIRFDRRS